MDGSIAAPLAVVLAATAAVCNAAGDLLQRHSARTEHSAWRESLSLVGHLLHRPAWLAGCAVSLLGLGIHIGALSLGELATVQPILVGELPLAVLGSAYLFGRRLAARDLVAVAALAGGLALFVACLAPDGGRPLAVPGSTWALGITVVLAVMATLVVYGWRAEHDLRGGLLSAASGVGYGLTGVFFSVTGRTFGDDGVAAALTTWQTWAAVATGTVSFYLLQNAMAAGRLVAVEPGLTLANPIIAVTWGLLVFSETARTGPALVGTVAGGALLVVGVVLLARSPVLENHSRGSALPSTPRAGEGAVR